jgi:enediyne biosynthesis protein E4
MEMVFPQLRERCPTHGDYASASLSDIFTAPLLDAAYKVEVNTLASEVMLNNGNGRFAFQALPNVAQIAPGFWGGLGGCRW